MVTVFLRLLSLTFDLSNNVNQRCTILITETKKMSLFSERKAVKMSNRKQTKVLHDFLFLNEMKFN